MSKSARHSPDNYSGLPFTEIVEQSDADDGDRARARAKSFNELLTTIESLASQRATLAQIENSSEFQELMLRIGTDRSARKRTLEHFVSASGTALGDALSLALGMSASATELPEVKASAMQLLRTGSPDQQLNALLLLQRTNSQDDETRATVLDMLRRNVVGNDPKLALAALESLSQTGKITPEQRGAVVDAVAAYVRSPDIELRAGSVQAISQWGGNDESALNLLTEAADDAEPGIRSIALTALAEGQFPFENVRGTLLKILNDSDEEPDVRLTAMHALEKYSLDDEALLAYQKNYSALTQQESSRNVGFN